MLLMATSARPASDKNPITPYVGFLGVNLPDRSDGEQGQKTHQRAVARHSDAGDRRSRVYYEPAENDHATLYAVFDRSDGRLASVG